MKISFKQFRAMTSHEVHQIYFEAGRGIDARNFKLSDESFVHDAGVSDLTISKLLEKTTEGSSEWYVLNREKYGRLE